VALCFEQYAEGQYVRVGDIPKTCQPTAEGGAAACNLGEGDCESSTGCRWTDEEDNPTVDPDGYTACASNSAENCWAVCLLENVMTPENYVVARDIIRDGQAEIFSFLQVEQVAGPLRLAEYQCGEGLVESGSPPTVPDTDLYISTFSRPYGDGGGVAFASVCQRDQNGRPVSGVMGLQTKNGQGPHMGPYSASNVATIVHERALSTHPIGQTALSTPISTLMTLTQLCGRMAEQCTTRSGSRLGLGMRTTTACWTKISTHAALCYTNRSLTQRTARELHA
jgi:hypothetical protein